MHEADEIVSEFLVESYEGLDQLDRDLIELEQHPDDQSLLARVFRCVHTIKGTCGFLGFSRLESVTHVGENLLASLRDGELSLTPDITSALLTLVDAIRQMLSRIEESGDDAAGDFSSLVALLEFLQDDGLDSGEVEDDAGPAVEPHVETGAEDATPAVAAPGAIEIPPVAAEPSSEGSPKRPEARAGSLSESTLRVDVGLLDKLMNLVGELVLTRNQILQHTDDEADPLLLATCQRLDLITSELQESVMKTRMQPIGSVWSKFPRVVRDLAVACGKQVRVDLSGKDTELDKTILEAIKDPLTHIVRNSVDHGIESPEARRAMGKPAEGCLRLSAYHESGKVNIEIVDDGGGIDPAKIREKALARGVAPADALARMGTKDVLQLVFAPGFSTAEQVTNVSGRGVGMDVVKTNVERIGGSVAISSVVGQGTTLQVKIPLTLAIIPALIVTSGQERFAIPQVSLQELVRLEGPNVDQGIETIQGTPVHRLRGTLLPLVRLNDTLGLVSMPPEGDEPIVNIVVVHSDGHTFGLVVDRINDTEEIVVKPLDKQLKALEAFAGATIMGDGRVALILDVHGLALRGGVAGGGGPVLGDSGDEESEPAGDGEIRTLLLFGLGEDHRLAIPLSTVSRLEEIPRSMVERTGRHEVVQYREHLLPLVRLGDLFDTPLVEPGLAKDPLRVVVYDHGGRRVGLVVDHIIDIVRDRFTVHRRLDGGLLYGSTVVEGRITDLVDLDGVLERSQVVLYESEYGVGDA